MKHVDPALFGRTRRIVLGKHSGMAAVTNALALLGVAADECRARRVLDDIRTHAIAVKRPVGDLELLEFYAATGPQGSVTSAKADMDLETQC